jgi:hypothetical protein
VELVLVLHDAIRALLIGEVPAGGWQVYLERRAAVVAPELFSEDLEHAFIALCEGNVTKAVQLTCRTYDATPEAFDHYGGFPLLIVPLIRAANHVELAERWDSGLTPHEGSWVTAGSLVFSGGAVDHHLGQLALVQGQTRRASELLSRAIAGYEAGGDRLWRAWCFADLAEATEDNAAALGYYAEARAEAEVLGLRPLLERCP